MQRPQARVCCPCLGREGKKATKAHSNKGLIAQFSIAISAFLPARLNFRLSLERPGGFGNTACSCHSELSPGLWEEGQSLVLEEPLRPFLISAVVTASGSLWGWEGPRESTSMGILGSIPPPGPGCL